MTGTYTYNKYKHMKFMFIYKNRNMPLHFSYINIYIVSITIIIASSNLSNKHLGFVPCDRSLNPSKLYIRHRRILTATHVTSPKDTFCQ